MNGGTTLSTRGKNRGEQRSDDGPSDVEETRQLPKTVVFTILKNTRRRAALRVLRERGPELLHGELAEHVAARENGIAHEAVTSKQRKRVYISLYQNHLPRLAEDGVIDYESNRGTVELRPEAQQVYDYLDLVDRLEDRERERTSGDRVALAIALGANALVLLNVAVPVVPYAPLAAVAALALLVAAIAVVWSD